MDNRMTLRGRPMARRLRSLSPFLALSALLALAAVPAMAKEGAEARLDTAISRDAEPGSTIDVGWSTFMIVEGKERPVYGSQVYIQLVSPDGTGMTEQVGVETRSGSGHYKASIQVPPGGIGQVIVGMVGEACPASGGCYRSDVIFPLTDDALVSGVPPVAASTTAVSPGGPTVGGELIPIVAIGTAVAIAGGLVALIAGRRRSLGTGAIGR
jgi:hypothetical protein